MHTSLTIQELLYARGLSPSSKIKLVRHKDNAKNLYQLYKDDAQKFLQYQSRQEKEYFKGADFIVSFIGEDGTLARFIGVFEVKSVSRKQNGVFLYDLPEVSGFVSLKDRVIIDWGKAALSWCQWNTGKMVYEILPPEVFYARKFKSYTDVVLTFEELREIIGDRRKFKEWHLMLSAVKGIYLILDKHSGMKYIGSAYGDNGIWGRWEEYAITGGHGNNMMLKDLLRDKKNYSKNLQFAILLTLPKTLMPFEVINYERLFKAKLGTQTFGLNLN